MRCAHFALLPSYGWNQGGVVAQILPEVFLELADELHERPLEVAWSSNMIKNVEVLHPPGGLA